MTQKCHLTHHVLFDVLSMSKEGGRIGPDRGERVTSRQLRELRRLSQFLGWGRPALRAWLTRWHHTDREEWLTASRASRAIQGLRAMVERKQGATAR